jgi:cbb3-type cytochrome oxidase maturation protein
VSILYLLVPLALALVGVFVALYVWSTRSGQFDDLHTPALRALLDERPSRPTRPPEETPPDSKATDPAPDDPPRRR